MNNTDAYYQSCLEEAKSQDAQNTEFSIKALGILTFGATIFGVGTSWIGPNSVQWIAWSFLAAMGGALAFVACYAVRVLRPHKWRRAFDVSELRGVAKEYESDKQESNNQNDFVREIADSYTMAIRWNWKILDHKADMLQCLIKAAVIELAAFVLFRICLLFPCFP